MELHKVEININRYANGELSGEALKEFEALLQKDTTLQEKVDSHEFMDALLFKNLGNEDQIKEEQTKLKPFLNKFGNQYFSEDGNEQTIPAQTPSKPNRIIRLFTFAALAAAAILLFLFIPNQKNRLYTQFFEPPLINIQLSKPTNPSNFEKANMAYSSKNYKEAINLYDQSLKEETNQAISLLHKGGAELALDRDEAALKTFQQLAGNYPNYADIAHWYLALCHLKKGDEAQTKTMLKRITTDDKEYFDKAQQLLMEL